MVYDCIIIGGGIAGLTCGIRCVREGLRTVILSGGTNSLHFSSGSIDLFGYTGRKKVISDPFDYIKDIKKNHPGHPYEKVGQKTVREAMAFITEEVAGEGFELKSNGTKNHLRLTGLGTMKPTYLSPRSVFNDKINTALNNNSAIAVLNFEGFRDYYQDITAEQLKKHPSMQQREIRSGKIDLPYYSRTEKNIHEFRSIDLARIFDSEKYLPRIADEIARASGDAEIVCIPAFIGIDNYTMVHKRLEEMTGKIIYEVPTLPPSILGMRLDNALRSRFAALGGEYSSGDSVVAGAIEDGAVQYILTRNFGTKRHYADKYVIATGSFFSGGLKSEFDNLEEPIFSLKMSGTDRRNKWYSSNFFDRVSHPFLSYGIETNASLNPFDIHGKPVKNLYGTGAILAGYNPIREGSGGGVAISTGYYAAGKIISGRKKGSSK